MDIPSVGPATVTDPERLAADNMRLAHWMAYRFANQYGVDPEEADNQAQAALTAAANAYDPSRGTKFSSTAAAYIRNSLRRLVKPLQGQRLGRVDLDTSFGDEEGGDDATMHDVIGQGGSNIEIEREDIFIKLRQELNTLPSEERELLSRWIAGETYRDIAVDSNVSFVQVGNIIRRALAKLKAKLVDKGITGADVLTAESSVKWLMARMLVEAKLASEVNEMQMHSEEISNATTAEDIYNIIQSYRVEDPYSYKTVGAKLDRLCHLLDNSRISEDDFVGQVHEIVAGPRDYRTSR